MENRMKNCNALSDQTTRRFLPGAGTTALALAWAISLSAPALAGRVTPPSVPPEIRVEDGNVAFLVGHALGTQNYVCRPSAAAPAGVAYVLFTPEATLFNDDDGQIITHFFSPNPDPLDPNTNPAVLADGAIRAAWQHSRDNSTVWARVHQPVGAVNVDKDAIDWLLLDVVGAASGLAGGDFLTRTTFIHRVNTTGGRAPATGCALSTDVGNQAFVPYTADYFFYFNPQADQ
jgi:hypothetical protein